MFESFAHYLSYGATDQQTARELTGSFDGLLVPGTVAAFQADGTKGFVLTLSASKKTRYVVDSRFPLFQQKLQQPKKSHESLARLLGDESLVSSTVEPTPSDFDDDRIETIATGWLNFNVGFTNVSSKHFAKYALRLGEELLPPENTNNPEYILAPYTMSDPNVDDWWAVAERLWVTSNRLAIERGITVPLIRVVAAKNVDSFAQLVSATTERRLAVWVDGLDELSPTGIQKLIAYGAVIKNFSSERDLFSLYGGFFAVLLGMFGLRGASHGIGYGEYRSWLELPNSGPPPARYYLPMAHRYVSQDLAEYLFQRAPQLVSCGCPECVVSSPGDLEYHKLMKHSVHARAAEIAVWPRMSPEETANRLEDEALMFESVLLGLAFPKALARGATQMFSHLRPWAHAIRSIDAC